LRNSLTRKKTVERSQSIGSKYSVTTHVLIHRTHHRFARGSFNEPDFLLLIFSLPPTRHSHKSGSSYYDLFSPSHSCAALLIESFFFSRSPTPASLRLTIHSRSRKAEPSERTFFTSPSSTDFVRSKKNIKPHCYFACRNDNTLLRSSLRFATREK
jgi:hypothetical protein